MSDLERRSFTECRVSAEDAKRLNGYAIVFNSLSVDLGGFREIISPDAVDRALKEGTDVRALVDHDSAKILGRVRAGTLGLRKDTTGLRVSIEPDTQISYAADIMRSVARGDVSGMSFGFRTLADEWNYEGKIPIRTVTDMKLSEVSVVTFPAYEQTNVDVAMRSLEAFRRDTFGSSNSVEMRRKWHRTQLAK